MVLIACVVLTLAAGTYVLRPLFTDFKGNLEAELLAETELDRLLNRKAVVYTNLKELEFEYKMGRLGDADYQRLETGYKLEAAGVLQQLDQLGVEQNIDEMIEKEVSARRGKPVSARPAQPAGNPCPSCGAPTIAGKNFCADCGHNLQ